jgi:hypothetical protein
LSQLQSQRKKRVAYIYREEETHTYIRFNTAKYSKFNIQISHDDDDSIQFSSLFLCGASITKRPIIGTAQNIHLRTYNHNYYNNKNTTTTSTINNYKIIELIN